MPDEGVPFVRTRNRKRAGKFSPDSLSHQVLAGGHERAARQPAYEGPRGIPHVTDDQAEKHQANLV